MGGGWWVVDVVLDIGRLARETDKVKHYRLKICFSNFDLEDWSGNRKIKI